jgi:hypothetical protein
MVLLGLQQLPGFEVAIYLSRQLREVMTALNLLGQLSWQNHLGPDKSDLGDLRLVFQDLHRIEL